MQKPRGRKGLRVLVVQEVCQYGQVPWSLEGGDRGRRRSLWGGAGQALGSELFWSLGWLPHHLASLFPYRPVHACRKREARPGPAQPSRALLSSAPFVSGALDHKCKHLTAARSNRKKKKNQKIERERTNHLFQPLLSMQSEGHMEINIFGSDNTVFLGVLIKRRRLLNTLLLRAQLRKPVLLFILNSDERPHTAHTPQLSLSPL